VGDLAEHAGHREAHELGALGVGEAGLQGGHGVRAAGHEGAAGRGPQLPVREPIEQPVAGVHAPALPEPRHRGLHHLRARVVREGPKGRREGLVVAGRDRLEAISVFLELGAAEGIYPGTFATVFRDNAVKGMPRQVMGEVGVLTVDESYATALITRAWSPLSVGDRIEVK